MDEVTKQNAALVEESSAAAEALDSQAHALTDIVGRFKTGLEARRQAPRARAPQPVTRLEAKPMRTRRPELGAAKPPVSRPKDDDDGKWDSF